MPQFRFVIQAFDREQWCPVLQAMFAVDGLEALRAILDGTAADDPELENIYFLDDEKLTAIRVSEAGIRSDAVPKPHRVRTAAAAGRPKEVGADVGCGIAVRRSVATAGRTNCRIQPFPARIGRDCRPARGCRRDQAKIAQPHAAAAQFHLQDELLRFTIMSVVTRCPIAQGRKRQSLRRVMS